MTWKTCTEAEFVPQMVHKARLLPSNYYKGVTGPGRSGAVCAAYMSHFTGIPFIPHKSSTDLQNSPLLVCDTVEYTGKTIRKALSWYRKRGFVADSFFVIKETRGCYYKMWYEISHLR